MNIFGVGMMVGVCSALVAAGCGDSTEPPATTSSIEAQISGAPEAVKAIYITVTGLGISGDIHATLVDNAGTWTGSLSVPPGTDGVVTAYAYDVATLAVPVLGGTADLIYTGVAHGVVVNTGVQTDVPITLLPYPADGGGIGTNTAPRITNVTQPGSIAMNNTATMSATAVDLDVGDSLTYTWTDNGIGGGFGGNLQSLASDTVDAVTYTPPTDFVGAVLIQVTVTDLAGASATAAFHLVVNETGIDPVLTFDVLPLLTIESVQQQALLPGTWTQIHYSFTESTLPVTGLWTDDCGGMFTPNGIDGIGLPMTAGPQSVIYTAPSKVSGAAACTLTFTATDSALASVWSSTIVWVENLGKIAFVTSIQVDGQSFDGDLTNADNFCNSLAMEFGVLPQGSSYTAFLSNGATDAGSRIAEGPYVLSDGTPVVTTKADLFAWGLLHPIDMDDRGEHFIGGPVFTGTNTDGTRAADTCLNWSSGASDDSAVMGNTGSLDSSWVNSGTMSCNQLASVYCFQNDNPR